MTKDTLLSDRFFSSYQEFQAISDNEAKKNFELIKTHLYSGEEGIYYLGKHYNEQDFLDFIQSEAYPTLQKQLRFIIDKLKQWSETHQLEGGEELEEFLKTKLEKLSSKASILYADGKKALETITILLEDDHIDLDLRKRYFAQLLADHELLHCIDGCFTRIVNTAQSLLTYKNNPNQLYHWIRSFVTEIARKVAAQRPFAMPESYQILICRILNISPEANEFHASNYLLLELKKNGLPIAVPEDLGALEIQYKLEKKEVRIVELYLEDLLKEITATDLIDYIATHLHSDLQKIMNNPTTSYLEKMIDVESKLTILGKDSTFLLNEILDDETFALTNSQGLKITILNRLTDKKWLNAIEKKEIVVSLTPSCIVYHYPGNIELDWFQSKNDQTRYRLMDMIQGIDLGLGIKLESELFKGFLREIQIEINARDLILLFRKSPPNLLNNIRNIISTDNLARILKQSNPRLFVNILQHFNQELGWSVLNKIDKSIIYNIMDESYLAVNPEYSFFGLKKSYYSSYFNRFSESDSLLVTQELLKQIISKGFRDFNNIIFDSLPYIDYLNNIDFSDCQFNKAIFHQKITNCKFDRALLEDAVFNDRILSTSFKAVDLRKTYFTLLIPSIDNVEVSHAIFSTQSFKNLLKNGFSNFQWANLREVDFQQFILYRKLRLDLTAANLAGCDLRGFDFGYIKLQGSNLENTDLRGAFFRAKNLDASVDIRGAKIDIFSLYESFYEAGVRKFDQCEINQWSAYSGLIEFERTSFKKAKFLDDVIDVRFIASDMTDTHFFYSKDSYSRSGYNVIRNARFIDCLLSNTAFSHVKLQHVRLEGCLFNVVKLDAVEISIKTAFQLYKQGQRDFRGIKSFKGKLPEPLPLSPFSEASLSEKGFISLIRLGLRDFSESNLNGFFLGERLKKESIREIDLKLEGASYKQSPLGCTHKAKREIHLSLKACILIILFQRKNLEKKSFVSWGDLISEADLNDNQLIFKEVILSHKPLYRFQVEEIHFYWGYEPDYEDLVKLVAFIKESTLSSQRGPTYLQINIPKKLPNEVVKTFARYLDNLGFGRGQLIYYLNDQIVEMDLITKYVKPTKGLKLDIKPSLNSEQSEFIEKPEKKLSIPLTSSASESKYSGLKNAVKKMKMGFRAGMRAAGREGTLYELGAFIMGLIAERIYRGNSDYKAIDGQTKSELRQFARQISEQEGDKRWANERERNTAYRIAVQCIDRGECFDHETVKRDIIDTYASSRPGIDIGNEVLWEKIKELVNNIGEYFNEKIKKFVKSFRLFQVADILVEKYRSSSESIPLKQKRILVNWYENPLLIKLINEIEQVFELLGYDMSGDPDFSESSLATYLYDLGLALCHQGITHHSSLNISLSLLKDRSFMQSVLDGNYSVNKTCCPESIVSNGINITLMNPLTHENIENIDSGSQHAYKRSILSSDGMLPENYSQTSGAVRYGGFLNSLINEIRYSFYFFEKWFSSNFISYETNDSNEYFYEHQISNEGIPRLQESPQKKFTKYDRIEEAALDYYDGYDSNYKSRIHRAKSKLKKDLKNGKKNKASIQTQTSKLFHHVTQQNLHQKNYLKQEIKSHKKFLNQTDQRWIQTNHTNNPSNPTYTQGNDLKPSRIIYHNTRTKNVYKNRSFLYFKTLPTSAASYSVKQLDFQPKQNFQLERYPHPKFDKKPPYRESKKGLSYVTAQPDMHSTLFACNVIAQCFNKNKTRVQAVPKQKQQQTITKLLKKEEMELRLLNYGKVKRGLIRTFMP